MQSSFLLKNYLNLIKGSLGAKLFRHYWMEVDGRAKDVLENGQLSCAVFVSSVLKLSGLINEPHATVISTVKDLESSGWVKIVEAKPGAVLVWEKIKMGLQFHGHLGFYIGAKKAVSNSDKKRFPAVHHWTYGTKNGKPVRKIEAIYWHPRLD